MLESPMLEAHAKSRMKLLLASVAAVLMLAACAHSRVVRREYDRPSSATHSQRHSRPAATRVAGNVPEPIPTEAFHVVRAGETLYGISFRFGLRYQDVAGWNGLADPYVIEIGQRLHLRGPSSRPDDQLVSSSGAPLRASRPQVAAANPEPRMPGSPGSQPQPPRTIPAQAAPARDVGGHAVVGSLSWVWPAQGQIIGRYLGGDQLQQGINIAGSAGQPIKATANGVVVYSGAGLVGYGELIIIKHSDEWLSAYAHNRRRLVTEGARVRGGDVIAEMGRTGAARDMLHFEIRRNGKPVDPLVLLPKP